MITALACIIASLLMGFLVWMVGVRWRVLGAGEMLPSTFLWPIALLIILEALAPRIVAWIRHEEFGDTETESSGQGAKE